MNNNENWKNELIDKCIGCDCAITSRDTFFEHDGKMYCKRCGHAKKGAIPLRYVEGKAKQFITRDSFSSLPDGIYRLRLYKGMMLIRERLENADNKRIRELTENRSYVLEKRPEGFMLRFPTRVRTYYLFFNIMDPEYEELDNLIDRRCERDLKVICEYDNVLGISVVPRTGVYKKRFACYEDGFVLFDLCEVGSARCDEIDFDEPEEVTEKKKEYNLSQDMLEYFEKRLIGQQKAVRKIVYLFCEYLIKAESGGQFTAANWVLTAPSGCGKTEVFRILRSFCKERGINIPVLQIDLSLYSEAGYKGKEVSEIIDQIAAANDKGDGAAIVFLDEADKKFVPSISSSGIDFNAAAQANLLTLVEGSVHEKTKRNSAARTIDTRKTMFVFMGAFQSIRDSRQKKHTEKRRLGFGSGSETKSEPIDRFYDDITIEDMIEFGMLEELAGRMEQVINLHRLPENDMRRLISEKARLVAEETGIEIELDEDAVTSFLEIAYTNLGIRNVMNRIRRLVCDNLSDVYFSDDFDRSKCVVRMISADLAKIGIEDKDGSCEFTA